MSHRFPIRVYFEDTDLAGIVYYANYLKFIERARSEMLRDHGIDQTALRSDDGVVFAVRRVEADYVAAAKFDDALEVRTVVRALTGARIVLRQAVYRADTLIFDADVTLVALLANGKPARIPASIRRTLQ